MPDDRLEPSASRSEFGVAGLETGRYEEESPGVEPLQGPQAKLFDREGLASKGLESL